MNLEKPLKLGSYHVSISDDQLQRLGFKNVTAQSITITSENAIVSGVEFIIDPIEDKKI